MKLIFVLLFAVLSLFVNAQTAEMDCLPFFKRFDEPWKVDSLGQNGFRTLMYLTFTGNYRRCSFNGHAWKNVEPILGYPNIEQVNGNYIVKRYYCSGYNETNKILSCIDIVLNQNEIVIETKFHDIRIE